MLPIGSLGYVMPLETAATILICDADEATVDLLTCELGADGYLTSVCTTLAAARTSLAEAYPDLLILGRILPDGDGLELVRTLRASGDPRWDPDLPVMMLSDRCGESDRVRTFEAGGDDFLAKPFSYRELRGRLQALLRRAERRTQRGRMRIGPLALDPAARQVTVGDALVALTKKEYSLLRALAADPGRVYTKDELLRAVWGYRAPGARTTRTLDSHACRLRAKLQAAGAGDLVVNVWGVGYRLLDDSALEQPTPVAA